MNSIANIVLRLMTVVIAAVFLCGFAGSASANRWPSEVDARYKISFAGITIGHFQFRSQVAKNKYELTSNSKFSVFFGTYKWASNTKTNGVTVRGEPYVRNFGLEYRTKKKRGSTNVTFRKGKVLSAENQPPARISRKHVPLTAEHLKGVLDPMTAIMLITRGRKGNPCSSRYEIFDGRRRFRVVLSRKGRTRIDERKRSNQPRYGYVCGLRYEPIAGHKKNRQVNYLANTRDIRIILRPVPAANVFVPYRIAIPTIGGQIVIASSHVDIVNAQRQKIALRH